MAEQLGFVEAEIGYLADFAYKTRKPFLSILPSSSAKDCKAKNGEETLVEYPELQIGQRYDTLGEGMASSAGSTSIANHNLVTMYQDGIRIIDVRKSEQKISLDSHGFEIWLLQRFPTPLDFAEDNWIVNNYYEQISAHLKTQLRASSAKIFNHQIRRSTPNEINGKTSSAVHAKRSRMAHIDQTFAASIKRAERHTENGMGKQLEGRFQIIKLDTSEPKSEYIANRTLNPSVWHPIGRRVEDWPLAFCVYSSINQREDLVAGDFIRHGCVGEQWYAKYNPSHRWYYISNQQPHEIWIFKIYDSSTDGIARCKMKTQRRLKYIANFKVPLHCAFDLSKALRRTYIRPRVSIELRCLVFYSDEPGTLGPNDETRAQQPSLK